MNSPTVQHLADVTNPIPGIVPARTIQMYNGTGAVIPAGTPVDLDLSVTTVADGRALGIGGAVKIAAVGTKAIGAPTRAMPIADWAPVQVAGIQASVIVGATVVAGDELAVDAAGVLGPDQSVLRIARGVIAAAAVATMFATPVSVIAAPGAGLYNNVERCHWFLDFASAAYNAAAAGDTLNLKFTNAAGAAVVDAVAGDAIGAAAADYHTDVIAVPEVIPAVNAAIVASIAAGEWGTGDSPLRYEIHYRVRTHDLSVAPTFTGSRPLVARALTAYAAGTATVLWRTGLGLA